jgi:hypothetical protein
MSAMALLPNPKTIFFGFLTKFAPISILIFVTCDHVFPPVLYVIMSAALYFRSCTFIILVVMIQTNCE